MSDIDFDELDRAVASVLNAPTGTKKAKADDGHDEPAADVKDEPEAEPKTVPSEPEARPEPVIVHTPAPAEDKPEHEPRPEPTKIVAPPAQQLHPVAQKPVQRGRFLDMVHPAHDMAPRPAVQAPLRTSSFPESPAASGDNQTFVSDVVEGKDDKKTAPEPAPANAPEASTAELKPAAPAAPAAPAPEPAAPAADTPAKPEPEHTDFFAPAPTPAAAGEPAPSPFIPDAKVEKRPLGAFSVGDAPAASASLPVGDALHDKLVQVESEDNLAQVAETDPTAAPAATTAPAARAASATIATPVAAAPAVSAPAPTPVKPAAPVVGLPEEHHGLLEELLHHDKPAPNARTESSLARNKGTLIWVTVAVVVLLIGVAVGASLYFALRR